MTRRLARRTARRTDPDLALALRHAPLIWFDDAEPFLPQAVGYTVLRRPGHSPTFERFLRLDVPGGRTAAAVIEYALWTDWDIQHLYELEHVWSYVDEAGRLIHAEASWHGEWAPLIEAGRLSAARRSAGRLRPTRQARDGAGPAGLHLDRRVPTAGGARGSAAGHRRPPHRRRDAGPTPPDDPWRCARPGVPAHACLRADVPVRPTLGCAHRPVRAGRAAHGRDPGARPRRPAPARRGAGETPRVGGPLRPGRHAHDRDEPRRRTRRTEPFGRTSIRGPPSSSGPSSGRAISSAWSRMRGT